MIELGQLEAHYDEFAKRHARVVTVSVDDLDDSQKTQQDFPRLTVVADREHKLTDAAGVLYTEAVLRKDVAAPTTILVDKQGVVRGLFRPTNVARRLSAGEVLAMVDNELAVSK
jgi:peroxiredoxin